MMFSQTFSFTDHARLMGRFDLANPEAPVAAWVNSAVFLTFEGTEICLTAEDRNGANYLAVIVDNMCYNWFGLEKGRHEYTLAADLPDKVHTLEIHKRTELLNGKVTFCDIKLPRGGRFLPPPPAKPLKLEFFGDSVTNGCGNGHPHALKEARHLDDGYMSYAGISARMLQAEYHTMAVSGIGIYQDALGGINGLPVHFTGTQGVGSPEWDFSKYIADGVVINLGQNDYSNPCDERKYVQAYTGLIDEIFARYPDTYVFCCAGPMNNNFLSPVKKVTEHYSQKGNGKVHLYDFGVIHSEVEGMGGWFHPSLQTHYRMGQDLARYISSVTGWELAERPKEPYWLY